MTSFFKMSWYTLRKPTNTHTPAVNPCNLKVHVWCNAIQFFFSSVTKMLWKIQGSPISCPPSHQSRGVKDGVEGLILFRWPPRWWMDRCGEGQREVREKAKGGTLSQVLDKSNGRSALHQTLTDCCRGVMMDDCVTACWLDRISCFWGEESWNFRLCA